MYLVYPEQQTPFHERDVLGSSIVYPEQQTPFHERDVLGSSLVYPEQQTPFHERDVLGSSLVYPEQQTPFHERDVLGSSLVSPEQQTPFDERDVLGSSLVFAEQQTPFEEIDEQKWLEELKESINGKSVSSTPSRVQRQLQFDRVKAEQKPVKQLKSYLSKDVCGAKKLKIKALNIENIRNTMKKKCHCGEMCLKKVSFLTIKNLRMSYWSQSSKMRRQLLKLHVRQSHRNGKHRVIHIDDKLSVCSKAFLDIFRINKNSLSSAIKSVEKDIDSTPGRCPREMTENSLVCINWLEDYASFYGDRMPNTGDVKLPYKFKKKAVYMTYKRGVDNPVSKSQFFKMWKTYFPHLKIKQTNSFSKCATCTILEKHRENAIDYESKAMYGQLKDEHHERQHMERRYYYGKRDISRKIPLKAMSVIIDGMDQSKTNLPHFSGRISKDVNPADLLKTRVTGVINHGAGGFHTYVDINEYPHDPNLTINVLLKALKKAADRNDNTLPPILYIQADNCGRENKNRYVLAFLELLVAENIFREVHLSFLYVGHTHEDIDAGFSKVSRQMKGFDVETLPQLLDILPESELIGQIYDIKPWIEPYIADMSQISFPLHYKFEKVQERVNMYYKGPHYTDWISIEETILAGKPCGKPALVQPNYSKICIEKNIKQIHRLKHIFKDTGAVNFWEKFYSSVKDNSRIVPETKWLLDELPRQNDEQPNIQTTDMPEHIQELINKETTIP